MSKSLDLVNTSISSLVEKSNAQHIAFLSKQDGLQNASDIHILKKPLLNSYY